MFFGENLIQALVEYWPPFPKALRYGRADQILSELTDNINATKVTRKKENEVLNRGGNMEKSIISYQTKRS